MNFMGLGFAFGAKDKGLSRAQKSYTKGFNDMGNSAKHLDSILSGVRVSNFLQSMSLMQLNRIRDGVQNLITDGGNLTTSFESTLTSNFKTTKQMGANFGKLGKDLQKFTEQAQSLSYGLNIGIENAAKAVKEFGLVNRSTWKALGINDVKDLAKATEVFGLDATELRSQLQTMNGVLGMTDEQIGSVMSSFQEMGTQTGDVGAALKSVPKIIEKLNKQAILMGHALNPAELAKMAKETAAAGAAFFQMGYGAEDARSMAEGLADTLISSQTQIANVFAGTDTELGQLLQSLSISTGDISQAFDLMKQGPSGFLKGFNELVKKAGPKSQYLFNMMRGQMTKALGEKGGEGLMVTLQRATGQTFDAMDKVTKATQKMGDAARQGFSTGLTLADRFERAQTMLITRLRQQSKAGQDFVKASEKAYKDWGDKLIGLAKEKGPIGIVSRKLIAMHQIGAKALLPADWQPLAAMAGTLMTELAPMVGVLNALWPAITALASPIGLLAIGVGAAALYVGSLVHEGYSLKDALKMLGGKIKGFATIALDFLKGAFEDVVGYLSTIDWVGVWGSIKGGLSDAFDGLMGLISEYLPVVAKGLLDGIWWVLTNVPEWIADAAPMLLDGLVSLSGKLLDSLHSILQGVADGIRDFLIEKFPESAGAIMEWANAFKEGGKIAYNVLKSIVVAVGEVVKFVVGALKVTVGPLIQSVWEQLKGMFTALWDLSKGIWQVISGVFKAVADVTQSTFSFIGGIFGNFATFADELFDGLKMLFTDPFTGMQMIADSVLHLVQNMFGTFSVYLSDLWSSISDNTATVWEGIKNIIGAPVEYLKGLWNSLDVFLNGVWNNLKNGGLKSFGVIGEKIQWLVDKIEMLFGSSTGSKGSPVISPTLQAPELGKAPSVAGTTSALVASSPVPTQAATNVASKQRAAVKPVTQQVALAKAANGAAMDHLAKATHSPDWYHEDFKRLFRETMEELTGSVQSLGGSLKLATAPAGSGRSARPTSSGIVKNTYTGK